MSRRPAFEPIRYAEHLEASGNFASDNSLLYEWSGTHWNALDDAMGERLAMKWIAANGCGSVSAANARSAVQTAVRWLPMLGNPSDDTVIPVQNGIFASGCWRFIEAPRKVHGTPPRAGLPL